jgi:hypothetical protein
MIQQAASILLTDSFQFAYFLPIRCNLLRVHDSWYPPHSIEFLLWSGTSTSGMAIMTLRVLANARLRGQRKCLLLRYLQSGAETRECPCLFFAYPVHRPHPSKPGGWGTQLRPTDGTVDCAITSRG